MPPKVRGSGGGEEGGSDPFAEVFRHHHARLVGALVRTFGPARLDLAEDVAQEAMLKAMKVWPFEGTPDRPDAWLLRVARNLALDVLRKQRTADEGEDRLRAQALAAQQEQRPEPDPFGGGEDDRLTLLFLCCHDELPANVRVTLTLKTVCGFGVPAIAAALLDKESTVAQRISRAKSTLRRGGIEFTLPEGDDAFVGRLASVLDVLYLLFNEGYRAHAGDELVREDLVRDALWLGALLARDERGKRFPEVHALLALMLFCGARLPARTEAGEALTLAEQDRSLWRHDWIQLGFEAFVQSIRGPRLTAWHVEAAIASVHAKTSAYEATDWQTIAHHYDRLLQLRPDDPIVRLNRAVALAKVQGPATALGELDALEGHPRLARYGLLHATRAHMLWLLERRDAAATELELALERATTAPERRLLITRLEACRSGAPAPRV